MHAGAIVGIIMAVLGALPQANTPQQNCCCNTPATTGRTNGAGVKTRSAHVSTLHFSAVGHFHHK